MKELWKKLKECRTLREMKEVISGALKDAGCTSPMGVYRWLGEERREKVLFFFLGLLILSPLLAIPDCLKDAVLYHDNASHLHGYLFLFNGTLLTLFVLFFAICRRREQPVSLKERFREYPWLFLLVLLLIWSCISTIFSGNFLFCFTGSARHRDGLFSYFLYAGILGSLFLIKNTERRCRLLRLFVHAAVPVSAVIFLQVCDMEFINIAFPYYRSSVFTNANYFGYYLGLVIPCLAGLLLYDSGKCLRRPLLYSAEMLLLSYAQILCDSFGSYLGTLVGVLLMPYLFKGLSGRGFRLRNLLPAALFLLVTLLSFAELLPMGYQGSNSVRQNFSFLFSDVESIADEDEDMEHAGSGRIGIWLTYLSHADDRPLTGYGPEGLAGTDLAEEAGNPRPHNEYLQWLMFCGFPGFTLYMSFVICFAVWCFRNIRHFTPFGLIAGAAVVSYLISAFFGLTLFSSTSYFWMLVGFLGSDRRELQASEAGS